MGTWSDVAIVVGDVRFPAHSAILAVRSKVFAAMLQVPMRESATKEIVLSDLEVHIVKQLLLFIYTGQVESEYLADEVSVLALLQVAHRFEVLPLIDYCVEVIGDRLQAETVADVLTAADTLDLMALRDVCIAFAVDHASEVQSTDAFKHLAESRPALMLDVFAALVQHCQKLRGNDSL